MPDICLGNVMLFDFLLLSIPTLLAFEVISPIPSWLLEFPLFALLFLLL